LPEPPLAMLLVQAFAVHVGGVVLAKVPAVHATVLLPEYPVAEHVRVQAAPDATSELAQSEV